jgi:hypothetical protein
MNTERKRMSLMNTWEHLAQNGKSMERRSLRGHSCLNGGENKVATSLTDSFQHIVVSSVERMTALASESAEG